MQRALIEQEYRTIYSEELTKRLASELRGDIEVQTRVIYTSFSPDISFHLYKLVELSFQHLIFYEQFSYSCCEMVAESNFTLDA